MAEQQEEPSFGPVRGLLVGTLALCLTNALAIAVQRLPRAGVKLRVLRHLLDAGQHLALGLVLIAVLALAQRLGTRRWLGRHGATIATAVAIALLAFPLLSDDVSNFAWRVAPAFPKAIGAAVAVGVGLGFAALAAAGDRVRSRIARAALAAAGLLVLALNHVLLPGGYTGVHLFAALAGVTAIAAALCTAKLPRRWTRLPARWPAALQLAPWAATALLVAPALLIWPGTPLVLELLRSEGSVVMPQLARLHAARAGPRAPIPVESRAWFQSRASASDQPPSGAFAAPDRPLVLLLSIDGLRADVLLSKRHDTRAPFLAKLRDSAVSFESARTPGAQTAYTLSSLFSCLHFSQIFWSNASGGIWPDAEDRDRFPTLLSRAGVHTFHVTPAPWMVNSFGVARGFADELHIPPQGTKYTTATVVTDAIVERLARLGDRPAFGFTHFLDTHAGMRGKAAGATPLEKHLSQLALIDGQIARIDAALEQHGLAQRTILIVTSDHGEAFGERGHFGHSTSLYDELLRVPLMIRAPGARPRRVETPVSVIDLGPTVLDLFGQPTPGRCMGESLAPFVAGASPTLSRPVAAEGRMKKMLLLQNRYKIVLDDQVNTEEVYDLQTDPKEERNLIAHSEVDAASWVSLARQFFDAHTLRRAGYSVPYRR